MVNDIDYQAPLGKSDHAVICFNLLCYTGEGRETIERKKYHLANYDAVRREFGSVNWEEEFKDKKLEESYSIFW